jgi:phage-related protein
MAGDLRLTVVFYRSEAGREPVREWLKGLPKEERKVIGIDLKTVQFGWPLGMPLVRKLEPGLWEVRSSLAGKIARVLFTPTLHKISVQNRYAARYSSISEVCARVANPHVG